MNAALDAVKACALSVIDACGDASSRMPSRHSAQFLKSAVDALLGEIFPELAKALNAAIDAAAEDGDEAAVDAVADTLKAGINALVEALRAGLNGGDERLRGRHHASQSASSAPR